MAYFDCAGARLHYEIFGCGDENARLILLLHGCGEDMHVFDAAVSSMLNTHRFVAIDSRAHGESTGEVQGYKRMAEDTAALLKHLGIEKVDCIGFSDGAIIAMLMASERDCFDRLMLIGANTHPSGLKFSERIEMRRQRKAALRTGDKRWASLFDMMLTEPDITADSLGRINARVTAVVGSRDMIKKSHTLRLCRAIKGCELEVLKGEGHMIPQEAPEKLAMLMQRKFVR